MSRLVLLLVALALPLAAAPEYPKMGPDIYDTKADGKAQVAAAVERAAAAKKHVLVVFGANWCIWCRRLHQAFEDPKIAAVLRANYEVVEIDVNTSNGSARNADLDERYGKPTKNGLPVLVVLDGKGKPLTTQETGALEEGDHHSPAKVVRFLERWKPNR
jgi:thiol:disulfide interchange protein